MFSFGNSEKLSIGAPFFLCLFANHYGWLVSKQYRFVPPIYHWFAETVASLKERVYCPTKFQRCINGDFTGFDLPKYLIYYRTTYSIHRPFSTVGLVPLPLTNDARIIATSKYEIKFQPELYCTAITPNYKSF